MVFVQFGWRYRFTQTGAAGHKYEQRTQKLRLNTGVQLVSRRTSLVLIGLVVIALYAVPYLAIGHIAAWYGSFLFWICAAVVIIFLNLAATAGFKGGEQ